MVNSFYVYEHYKPNTLVPFYVGKGTKNRAYVKDKRNTYWHNIVNKYGYEVKFIAKDIDEEFAFLIEIERIDQLKRLNIDICNMTNGGEGISGYRFKGKKRTKKQIETMIKYVSKPVYCITEDKYFDSAKQAAKYYELSDGAVSMVCRGKRNSVKKMKFCYVKNKEEV